MQGLSHWSLRIRKKLEARMGREARPVAVEEGRRIQQKLSSADV